MKTRILTREELEGAKVQGSGPSYDDTPYIEAVQEAVQPGGLEIELEGDERPRVIKMRIQKAATKLKENGTDIGRVKWVTHNLQGEPLPENVVRFVFRTPRAVRQQVERPEGAPRRGRPPKARSEDAEREGELVGVS